MKYLSILYNILTNINHPIQYKNYYKIQKKKIKDLEDNTKD